MKLFKKIRYYRWVFTERFFIRSKINSVPHCDLLKVILGAYKDEYEGWISTDYPIFDITNEKHWNYFFKKRQPDKILAEHVLEHLTFQEANNVLKFANKFMKKNSVFRIAVPDEFHLNPEYKEMEKPFGKWEKPYDHKFFWNYKSMSECAKKNGFEVELLEYWNQDGIFVSIDFSIENGPIHRSKTKGFNSEISDYSSLIVDLKK